MPVSANFVSAAKSLCLSDLGLMGAAAEGADERVTALGLSAAEQVGREGIDLEETTDDEVTVAMYAAYLYRKRAEDVGAMPRMLRYRLNNRLFAQKAGGADA